MLHDSPGGKKRPGMSIGTCRSPFSAQRWTCSQEAILAKDSQGLRKISLLRAAGVVQRLSHVWLLVTSRTARFPCSSPSARAFWNFHPSSQWCQPTTSSSVVPFSSCLQSFPASGSFQTSQFFASGTKSIGVSASASVLPMNIQDWFPLRLTGRCLCSPRSFQESSSTAQLKSTNTLALRLLYGLILTSIHDCWKNHSFD